MHKLRHYRHRIAHDDEPPQAEEDLELIANVDSKTRSIIELMAGVELNDTDISLRTALRNWADKRCDAMASWSGEWSEAKAQSEVFQSYEKSTSELARAMSKKIEELGRLYERWNDPYGRLWLYVKSDRKA